MAVDLKQFHQVFIEESVEGLDAMEAALMDLDVESIDDEVINTIFRSAHSIKGGAGTFGFSALAGFTHVLETLLDEVRDGRRGLQAEHVNLLLRSVDCMREMLVLIDDDRNEYTRDAIEVQTALEHVLGETEPKNALCERPEGFAGPYWQIIFKPNTGIIRTGNDPLRLIRDLCALAEYSKVTLLGDCPAISALNTDDCYFHWLIDLDGDALDKTVIEEVFDWVEDDCELIIRNRSHALVRDDGIQTQLNDRWAIHFAPYPHLFQTGNDPLRIFAELCHLGDIISCKLGAEKLPSLKLLDSEKSYLAWDIQLVGPTEKSVIEGVFEWVIGEGDIHITAITAAASSRPELAVDVMPGILAPAISTASTQTPPAKVALADGKPEIKTAKPVQKKAASEASSIRVGIDKIDSLINMVGELVITQSMLGQLGSDFDIASLPKLIEGLSQLEQNTRELQESVMRIRMLPISFAFSRFPRMVRDLGQSLGKKIHLVMQGENTELDKTVMEKIGDPLVHLVRNSVDHGIETAIDRLAKGKPEAGTVTLNAYHQGGNVVIEIIDDGRGLDRDQIAAKGIERGLVNETDVASHSDEQIFDLIFQPGFSTAPQVSDLSGRGVGMDVVKRNIQALNGVVEIQSKKGSGTKIRISLPLTLAILDGQLVRVGSATYIFPLVSIVESMQYREELVNHIAGGCSVFKLRDDYVPIVDLSEAFGNDPISDYRSALMVVVECDGFKVGMLVDELMAQQQVVIKSLEQNYKRIEGISGATILGDGTVALIIDVPGVVRLAGAEKLIQQNSLRKTA
ncbi:MAG TPA: chemotaxis protein CheA [Marinagarivorans sp.]